MLRKIAGRRLGAPRQTSTYRHTYGVGLAYKDETAPISHLCVSDRAHADGGNFASRVRTSAPFLCMPSVHGAFFFADLHALAVQPLVAARVAHRTLEDANLRFAGDAVVLLVFIYCHSRQ